MLQGEIHDVPRAYAPEELSLAEIWTFTLCESIDLDYEVGLGGFLHSRQLQTYHRLGCRTASRSRAATKGAD